MHYRDLADAIVAAGSVQTRGVTPAATLYATIAVDMKRKGKGSAFIRIRPGVFGLRALNQPAVQDTSALEPTPTKGDEAKRKRQQAVLTIRN